MEENNEKGITRETFNKAINELSPARKQLQTMISNLKNPSPTPVQLSPSEKRAQTIPVFPNTISYDEFFHFMWENKPVIIENITNEWKSSKEWILNNNSDEIDNNDDENKSKINFEFLRENFGSSKVSVALCDHQYFNDQERSIMTVSQFIDRISENKNNNNNNNNSNNNSNEEKGRLFYLKDWHFFIEYPNYSAFSLPHFLSDDWINEYYDYLNLKEEKKDDYRFVYIGKKGTFTPLHSDVFRSFSWSANITGVKKWTFIRPDQVHLLKGEKNKKELLWDIRKWETDLDIQSQFPYFSQVEQIIIYQKPGCLLFVPSGWFHQVENLVENFIIFIINPRRNGGKEDCISINHNWGNSCNIDLFWDFLRSELEEVMIEIEDCKNENEEWENLCQTLMKANSGINYEGFAEYISFIFERLKNEITASDNNNNNNNNDKSVERNLLTLFSLTKITKLIAEMKEDSFYQSHPHLLPSISDDLLIE